MTKTLKFFTTCQTIPEVKTEYKRLVKIYHPDLNPKEDTTEIMKKVNNDYEIRFSQIMAGVDPADKKDDRNRHNVNDQYREIINSLLHLEDIIIEIVGSWIWLSGNTYPVKSHIKSLKFIWSRDRKKWYWHSEEIKGKWDGKKKPEFEEIKGKYGCETFYTNGSQKIAM